MSRAKNITISVRFSREQLAYMHEALKMHGVTPSNLSDMIRQSIGMFVNFTDPNLFRREATKGSYDSIDLMTGSKVSTPIPEPDPFGIKKTTIAHRELISEPTTIIADPEQHALKTFISMNKYINEFPKEQQVKAKNLWACLQNGDSTIKQCLWDAYENKESELITAHLLADSGFFNTHDDLRSKYKARCEEVINKHYNTEQDKESNKE